MGWMSGHNGVLPFTAMIIVECVNVGSGVFFKAAASRGLSYCVLIVYSHAIDTIVLLPLPFIFRRTGLPPFKLSLIFKLFLLGIIRFLGSLCGYKGIEYSSPTLACFSYWEPLSSFYLHTCHNLQFIPVYVASFKPLSIVIAAASSFIFLGDDLYLGSIVGAIVLSIGFYVWGKAKEEILSVDCTGKTPLMVGYKSIEYM